MGRVSSSLILFTNTKIACFLTENTVLIAEIAQLVEHNLAKVRVASSSLVFRSKRSKALGLFFYFKYLPTLLTHTQAPYSAE